MQITKVFFGVCLIGLLVSCGGEEPVNPEAENISTTNSNQAGEALPEAGETSPETTTPTTEATTPKELLGTFCFGYNDASISTWGRIELAPNQEVTGALYEHHYLVDSGLNAYSSSTFTGIIEGDDRLYLTVTMTPEGYPEDVAGTSTTTEEGWFFSLKELQTLTHTLSRVGCNEYADHRAYFAANPPFDLAIDQENNESTEEVIACDVSQSVFVAAETKNYWVNICGSDLPDTYIGIDKKTGDRLQLDLSFYEEDGSYYEAVNGDYVYTVIFGSAKGNFLSVDQGGRQLLQEPLLRW